MQKENRYYYRLRIVTILTKVFEVTSRKIRNCRRNRLKRKYAVLAEWLVIRYVYRENIIVKFSNLWKSRWRKDDFKTAAVLPNAGLVLPPVCFRRVGLQAWRNKALGLNVFEGKNYRQYPLYWVSHSEVLQQRQQILHVKCISILAMWHLIDHLLQNVTVTNQTWLAY